MTEQTTETPPVPDVSEGRRLLTEATEGPWQVDLRDRIATSWERTADVDGVTWIDRPFVASTDSGMEDVPDAEQDAANASLIVWFRNNAAALLDAVEAVQRVRDLHIDDGHGDLGPRCAHCSRLLGGEIEWPCSTIRALDGVS